MLGYLSVGLVLRPIGLKGELKIKPLTDDPKRFDKLSYIYINNGKTGNLAYAKYEIQTRRYNMDFVYLKLYKVDSIEAAEKLRNQNLWIPRAMAIPLPEDTYFIGDILGSVVITIQGDRLGKVNNIIKTGSNDVYEVVGENREVLIPALKKVVKSIDIKAGSIVVDLTDMKGLLEDED
ncbi:MAG TPA: ribosome maturation factor RimM [Bacillota bacterium]|nr:ribosome maturation factor RimM [Bacillota bacterium]